jgi:hypothetical protein
MALKSIKNILAEASLVNSEQFQEWSKAWRIAVENGHERDVFLEVRLVGRNIVPHRARRVVGMMPVELRVVEKQLQSLAAALLRRLHHWFLCACRRESFLSSQERASSLLLRVNSPTAAARF